MKPRLALAAGLVFGALLGQPHAQRAPGLVADDAALAAEPGGEHWLAFGRTYSEQRFSPLTRIDRSTVSNLAVDWYLDLPGERGLVSTPLVAGGTLYFIGSMNVVRAVDAASGDLLWEYDPDTAAHAGRRMRAGWDHSRGIAYWKHKLYVATWDGRLNAVDAATGRELWSTMTLDPDTNFYITGAPKVFKDKVLVGNGGTEHGVARGYVTAYDAGTGEQVWRFHVVPGNPADGFENDAMAMAAETWTGEWWKYGGGGNAWHGFTYDPELDALYIGTGNGAPWNRKIRSPGGGDNLFLCSIVALDPDTGEYRWHYQTTPGETWDYNSNMDIVLADLTIEGRTVKALMHAPKNGFFYVLDRENGELVSAAPFTETTWATAIDPGSGRPVEVPGARYENAPAVISPGPIGAHNWHAMSYSPATGLAYFPAIHLAYRFTDEGIDLDAWQPTARGSSTGVRTTRLGSSRPDGVLGSLQAWDPVRQETGLGSPARRHVARGDAHHCRQSRLPGQRQRRVRRLRRGNRRGAVALPRRIGHLRAADNLRRRRAPVRGVAGGLGRRVRRRRRPGSGRPRLGVRRASAAADRVFPGGRRRSAGVAAAAGPGADRRPALRGRCGPGAAGRPGVRRRVQRLPRRPRHLVGHGARSQGVGPGALGGGLRQCRA